MCVHVSTPFSLLRINSSEGLITLANLYIQIDSWQTLGRKGEKKKDERWQEKGGGGALTRSVADAIRAALS